MPKHKKHKHTEQEPVEEACADCNCADQAADAPIDDYSPEDYETVLAQRDDFCGKYQRALADYQNAQRRFTADMAIAREAGVERVLSSLMPVLDHFDMALNQPADKVAPEQILAGVTMIRDEFNRAMAAFGVAPINPEPNTEFDPAQHEALSQLAVEGVEPGHISSVYQIGYRVNDRVIRPAKVTIAPPAEGDAGSSAEASGTPKSKDA
ncbi:Heat shock protein GrpE [hydrothermal vent metagenome]|uniref:Heat shock protein GrpE n=1 Tax=hydrothermal vent metagenome TaxID=652676 RepID=A0A3B1DWV2_9ZZZZ